MTDSTEIAVGIALANLPHGSDDSKIQGFIQQNLQDGKAYRLAKRGGIQGASIDFLVVLYSSGSLASLAAVLWMAYDKFIARNKDAADDAGIVVTLGPGQQLWIGKEFKDKDIFVHALTQNAKSNTQTEFWLSILSSDRWKETP